MKGIILHGGYGTRLRPLTHTGPKQLIPVANKPISQHALEDLVQAEIREIAIVLGDTYPDKVQEHYGDGSNFDANITYIHQGEPKGIAHAVGLCEETVKNERFVVYLGDNLLKGGIRDFTETFKTSEHEAMILLCEVENPQRFGVAKFNEKRKLVGMVEKPKQPPSHYALTGIYFFKPTIFTMIKQLKPSWRGELEITEAIQLLLENGYDVGYRIVEGWWKDTGAPDDILEANRLVLDELKPEIKSQLQNPTCTQGRVSIGKNTLISEGAIIRGPTIIGDNSTIDNDVYIGPYTSIGHHARVQRGEIENSIIMDNCYIDIDDRITDSLIGPNSRITSNNTKPKARKFLIGEQSQITL